MVFDHQSLLLQYEINPLTMIIFPYEYGSKTYSRIVEYDSEMYSPLKPTELVKKGCEYNLSDYNASKKLTRRLTRVTHKSPITIDPANSVFLLPTVSPNKPNCIWVSHEHVVDHRRNDAYSTMVFFRNEKMFILPVSYSSFNKQLLRTSDLRTKVAKKMIENERKAQYIYERRYSNGRIQSFVSERYRYDE
ncbi:competence protein ComK [Bacillus sp. B15-48]|uniref:competence protein ComK n=1 Tax=Bacillus sp. B15-48 TaxID=1548601 RepID=UPI00193ECCDC|nr:competence protein ComK [Bacillus sp. B15-48]MBM4764189.1 transcriptional regulator [Bacillus sp. B15-48]